MISEAGSPSLKKGKEAMTEPTMETLARRLDKVERENRWLKQAGVVALAVIAVGIAGFAGPANSAQKKFLVMGGGLKTGVYYQVVLGVCKLINEKLGSQGYECTGNQAYGSAMNIRTLRGNILDFGVVQSDHNERIKKRLAEEKKATGAKP